MPQSNKSLSSQILNWFDHHGRKDLPWQQNITPYRVWVSEIMLQQTQVKTVIPYYQKFINSFPNVESLAHASDDEVLHHWSGLGYYSRARNLHKTAKTVVEQYNGKFPADLDALIGLPGIGRSTAGAILAIAFQQWAAILDGNVKRVLARHFTVEGWPGQSAVANKLWQLAEEQTPEHRLADYTQAIMDLGATVCTRSRPNCSTCPLTSTCAAKASDTIAQFPGKKPKKTLPVRSTEMLLLTNGNGEILLEKRPPSGIWGGLWSLPEAPYEKLALTYKIESNTAETSANLPPLRHTFSHFHLDITPVQGHAGAHQAVMDGEQYRWYSLQNPDKLGLAAPIKKILQRYSESLSQATQQEMPLETV